MAHMIHHFQRHIEVCRSTQLKYEALFTYKLIWHTDPRIPRTIMYEDHCCSSGHVIFTKVKVIGGSPTQSPFSACLLLLFQLYSTASKYCGLHCLWLKKWEIRRQTWASTSWGGRALKMKNGPSTITEIKISVIKPSLLLQCELMWLNHKEHFYYQCLVNYVILPSGIYSCSKGPYPH